MFKAYLKRIENAFNQGDVLELAFILGEINVLLANKEITQAEHTEIGEFIIDHTTRRNMELLEMLFKKAITSAEFLVDNM